MVRDANGTRTVLSFMVREPHHEREAASSAGEGWCLEEVVGAEWLIRDGLLPIADG